jgi:tRNA(fMet)-specific endonuclease VapC
LLDTNVALQIVRAKNREKLISILNPKDDTFYISVVNEAELKSISIRNKWKQEKIDSLELFLQDVRIIEVSQMLVHTYVEIDNFLKGQTQILRNILLIHLGTWVKMTYG